MNVRSKRDVSRRPTKRDGQERGRHHPGLAHLVAGRPPVGDVPDDEQHQRIETQPRQRRLDQVREQEHHQGAEQLAHVRSAHHQLRPAGLSQVPPRDLRRDAVLEVPMAVQRDGVARHEPDELARGEDDLGADADGLEEEPEAAQGRLDVARLARERGLAGDGVVLGLLLLEAEVGDEVPGDGAEHEGDGRYDEGAVVAQLRDEDEGGYEGAGGAGDLIEDVDLFVGA